MLSYVRKAFKTRYNDVSSDENGEFSSLSKRRWFAMWSIRTTPSCNTHLHITLTCYFPGPHLDSDIKPDSNFTRDYKHILISNMTAWEFPCLSPWGQRLGESRLFCIHTVLDQCVVIQAIASIFSPALLPIWCTIGDIILQLSSQGVAVSGDVRLCTVDRICIVSECRTSGHCVVWVLDALVRSK